MFLLTGTTTIHHSSQYPVWIWCVLVVMLRLAMGVICGGDIIVVEFLCRSPLGSAAGDGEVSECSRPSVYRLHKAELAVKLIGLGVSIVMV
jgi:hypothetical protein